MWAAKRDTSHPLTKDTKVIFFYQYLPQSHNFYIYSAFSYTLKCKISETGNKFSDNFEEGQLLPIPAIFMSGGTLDNLKIKIHHAKVILSKWAL